jgi:hypothetical protein
MFRFSEGKIQIFYNIAVISPSATMSFEIYYSSSVWRVARAAVLMHECSSEKHVYLSIGNWNIFPIKNGNSII